VNAPRVVCCGEALVDMIATDSGGHLWRAVPGGSPYNAALAAGRLGAPTSFLGVISEDRFGRMLAGRLGHSHVAHDHCPRTPEPTTLAMISDGVGGPASEPAYTFHVAGTTTTSNRVNELHLPSDLGVLHVSGSVALVIEPAASRIENLLAAAQHRAIVHLDANPRPTLVDRPRFRRRVERWLGLADVVKLSEADVAWLAPGTDPLDLAHRWVTGEGDPSGPAERPAVAVVTRAAKGAAAVLRDGTVIEVQADDVDVVDTIGAGDTFSGALLAAFSAHGITTPAQLQRLDAAWWRTAITYAVEAAGITCSRMGADPPWRDELH
jgi:fructokinase